MKNKTNWILFLCTQIQLENLTVHSIFLNHGTDCPLQTENSLRKQTSILYKVNIIQNAKAKKMEPLLPDIFNIYAPRNRPVYLSTWLLIAVLCHLKLDGRKLYSPKELTNPFLQRREKNKDTHFDSNKVLHRNLWAQIVSGLSNFCLLSVIAGIIAREHHLCNCQQ